MNNVHCHWYKQGCFYCVGRFPHHQKKSCSRLNIEIRIRPSTIVSCTTWHSHLLKQPPRTTLCSRTILSITRSSYSDPFSGRPRCWTLWVEIASRMNNLVDQSATLIKLLQAVPNTRNDISRNNLWTLDVWRRCKRPLSGTRIIEQAQWF